MHRPPFAATPVESEMKKLLDNNVK